MKDLFTRNGNMQNQPALQVEYCGNVKIVNLWSLKADSKVLHKTPHIHLTYGHKL